MIRKLLLFLFLLACLPGGVYARIVFADLQNSYVAEWHGNESGSMSTKNGVSYTYSIPTSGDVNNWYGFSLWEIPISDLKFDATLDEDITVVADAMYTQNPFTVSVRGVKSNGTVEQWDHANSDADIPTTANSKGMYIATVNLNNLLRDKDLSQYKSLAVYLVRERQSTDDYGNITIRQVYLHQKKATNEVNYDPVNGSHYVKLESDAWAAWGCVSTKFENGKRVVTVEPKKDANKKYYTDAKGSPIVLGGLVLDIGQRDFTKVLRVQMNQEGGDLSDVYVTDKDDKVVKDRQPGKLLNYLDVVKQDGTDINNNEKFWLSQYDFRYIPYQKESASVRSMEWSADWPYGDNESTSHLPKNFEGQTMSFSQFLITYDVFRAEPWHEASLRNAPLYKVDDKGNESIDDGNFNYTTGLEVTGDDKDIKTKRLIFGSNAGYYASHYASVEGIDKIKIYATKDLTFEAVFDMKINDTQKSTNTGAVSSSYKDTYQGKKDNNQYYVYTIDVPKGAKHLNILSLIKGTGMVDNVTLYDASSPIDYFVSGQMWGSSEKSSSAVTAALSNPLAMNIDGTDLRNTNTNPIDLTPVNRNCLVYVKDESKVSTCHYTYDVHQGWVKDKKNLVVVSGGGTSPLSYKIEDLYLKDAVASFMHFQDAGVPNHPISEFHYPFYAPFDITTVSKAYYEMYVPEGKWGTLCLPFYVDKAQMSKDIELYKLNGTMYSNGHYYANVSKVDYIESNVPYIVKVVSGNYHEITSNSNSYVKKTVLNQADYLTGVYSQTTATPGTYVLQNLNDGLAFYRVAAGEEPTMYQFRAYFTKPDGGTEKAKAFVIRFEDGTTTTIKPNDWAGPEPVVVQTYDVSGVRRQGLRKGLNIVRMSDGSVRKVIK